MEYTEPGFGLLLWQTLLFAIAVAFVWLVVRFLGRAGERREQPKP